MILLIVTFLGYSLRNYFFLNASSKEFRLYWASSGFPGFSGIAVTGTVIYHNLLTEFLQHKALLIRPYLYFGSQELNKSRWKELK